MLKEVSCDRFVQKVVRFGPGLNVILGDEKGTNSVGKSSMLLVIDFILGGSTLSSSSSDIVKNIGHHKYEGVFVFNGRSFFIERDTQTPDKVSILYDDNTIKRELKLEEYRSWLAGMYGIGQNGVSFRSSVSAHQRIARKGVISVEKPLKIAGASKELNAVDGLLAIYNRYTQVSHATKSYNFASDKLKAARAAFKFNLIRRVTKSQRNEVENRLSDLEVEASKIKDALSMRWGVGTAEVAESGLLDLKRQKDALVERRASIRASLTRLRLDAQGAAPTHIESIKRLELFFPMVNSDRLLQIQKFHSMISNIVGDEIRTSLDHLEAQLSYIDDNISSINDQMGPLLKKEGDVEIMVGRLVEVLKEIQQNRAVLDHSTVEEDAKSELVKAKESMDRVRKVAVEEVARKVNSEMEHLANSLYGTERHSPVLNLGVGSHQLAVPGDKGTGTSFSGLLIFDLAVLNTSQLPFAIHDSLLFKNIETDLVENLLLFYSQSRKQIFIAIDEAEKYGPMGAVLFDLFVRLRLGEDKLLYDKNWRSKV